MATHKMYSNIVKADDDIIGLVAYALYKKQKIAFFNKVRKDTGKDPTEFDIKAFIINSSTESQINSYREQATRILMDLVANVTEEQIKQVSDEMLQNYEEKIRAAVKKETPGWLKTVGLNILGAFAFSIIVTIIFILGNFSEKFAKEVADGITTEVGGQSIEKSNVTPTDTISFKHD